MNVALYAYEGTTRYELDLYKEEPIKITLSAEEITDPTQINSTFSRQFRIPATNNNSRFFKYWYTSGVVDFDVTQKVTAEIHVDGIIYTTGQLRLVAAYENNTSDRIDFEVVFLGETKSFSSQVGDGYMNSLDCTDAAHVLSLQFVEDSWFDAWNASILYQVGDRVWYKWDPNSPGDMFEANTINTNSPPSLTNPNWTRTSTSYRTGNPELVRYILADRGYPYSDPDTNGFVDQEPVPGALVASEIAVDSSAVAGAGTHPDAFTDSSNPLYITQFTPIVQVKYLVDKIFDATDYTYTDDSVFNETWFKSLYIDGIATGFPFTPSGDGLSFATTLVQSIPSQASAPYPRPIIFPTIAQNNANAYNSTTGIYTCPVDGSYTFECELEGRLDEFNPAYDPEIRIAFFKNGSQVGADQVQGGPGPAFFFSFTGFNKLQVTANFSAGDEVQVYIVDLGGLSPQVVAGGFITQGSFACVSSPQQIAVNDLLKSDLKIIDWYKSILTKFRLVMVPDIQNPSQFKIQPWKDYIGSGETYDWTYKLDHKKDIKMEPLFFDQTADIVFTDQEDIDVTNTYQQDTFGEVFGTRRFVSGNELLSDSKNITTEFAPTPVSQIEGLFAFETGFIIPKFYERGDETVRLHGHLRHDPITPVQRLLFWNGLQRNTTIDSGGAPVNVTWYYTDGANTKNSSQAPLLKNGFTRYPRASYVTEIPTVSTSLNLNWRKQYPYYAYPGAPNTIGQQGEDVYQRYWSTYVNNIYSPYARKMTAYFNLDSEDMRQLTFDDLIFIKDSYWRIQKVYDAPLGEIATVKVELIKLLDYVGPVGTSSTIFDPADFPDTVDINSGGATNAIYLQQIDRWADWAEETGGGPAPSE